MIRAENLSTLTDALDRVTTLLVVMLLAFLGIAGG
jgi:hypothetical protein